MRLAAALGLALSLLAAGCGGSHTASPRATTTTRSVPAPTSELRVGIVGPLELHLPGVTAVHGTLARVANLPLVLVSNETAGLAAVARAARAHPSSHFALVGASTKGDRAGNLVGLVLRDEQAAQLAGIVAGYATADAGPTAPRVAWVGPQDRPLAAAFAQGVHRALPGATVLDEWSRSIPARCKEAALAGIDRGAMVVAADRGLCAEAAVVAARQQNVPGLQLSDFESRDVVTSLIARDAAAGVYHGGEDLVFGAASGAIGVGPLDPRISLATLVRARAAAQELASGAP
jgi:basic membrane lipoprotein Med (substrate-binding protein (PBP1-ABC) superfamily)